MDPVSSALILKALDGLSTRFAYTAQNIANASTPNYQPVRVSFEDALRAAADAGAKAIEHVKIETRAAPETDAPADMRLDLELANASQTALRYRALLDVLGRQMALHRAIAQAGGR